MADHSKIEWTDATWNALRGCSRASAGYPGLAVAGSCEGSVTTPNPPDHDWGDGHVAMRCNKKAAGHMLDGREHREVPHA